MSCLCLLPWSCCVVTRWPSQMCLRKNGQGRRPVHFRCRLPRYWMVRLQGTPHGRASFQLPVSHKCSLMRANQHRRGRRSILDTRIRRCTSASLRTMTIQVALSSETVDATHRCLKPTVFRSLLTGNWTGRMAMYLAQAPPASNTMRR